MSRRRLRQDLDHAISACLLVVTVAAIVTGIVAHLWDLNEFRYHVWAGYALTGFAVAHVWLNWGRLVAYARFRLRPRPAPRRAANPAPVAPPAPIPAPAGVARGVLLSRRGLLGLAAGGVAGLATGRGLRPAPVIEHGTDVGFVYHEWSKPGVVDALGTLSDWGPAVPLYKRYPGAPRVALPEPSPDPGLPTEEAMRRRRSTRAFAGAPMRLADLSRVLALTGGRTDRSRTAPSSGALYPIEVYPVVHDVDGLDPGVYHYGVEHHALHLVQAGDHREAVVRQALLQDFLGQANAVLFLTMLLPRMRPKYKDRSYRYGLIEAGHLGQNAYLAATSLGLGACAVGAFMDDAINAMLQVDGRDEVAVYMLAVGTVTPG